MALYHLLWQPGMPGAESRVILAANSEIAHRHGSRITYSSYRSHPFLPLLCQALYLKHLKQITTCMIHSAYWHRTMGHSQSKPSARGSKYRVQQPFPPNSPQKFTYTPLAGPRNIRILHLARRPGEGGVDHEDLELHASLVEASLDNLPEYFALSYTWGDPTPSQSIFINGRVLGITQNCADALRRMLRGKFERMIWVDSICINQGGMCLFCV
jgi:hypothetical protein